MVAEDLPAYLDVLSRRHYYALGVKPKNYLPASKKLDNLAALYKMARYFSNVHMQILSAMIHFIGVTVLGHCVSRRLANESLTSTQGWRKITWPRLCILLVFIDSWLFLFTTGIVIFGVGLEHSTSICATGIYLCIGFYGTSKFLTYLFLIERMHVVWSPTFGMRRLKSRLYIVSMITIFLYIVVVVLMIIGKLDKLRSDYVCIIGLQPYATIPLLSYDLYVNMFLTSLFLWPLLRRNIANVKLKRVATRTLVAAGVALTTSTVNILILTLFHGEELGWVCLGSCGTDVIVNALALFWVTVSRKKQSSDSDRSSRALRRPSAFQIGDGYPGSPSAMSPIRANGFVDPTLPYKSRMSWTAPTSPTQDECGGNDEQRSRFSQNVLGSVRDLFRCGKKREGVQVQITVTQQFDIHELSESEPTLCSDSIFIGRQDTETAAGDIKPVHLA